jgi:hypothetical protein
MGIHYKNAWLSYERPPWHTIFGSISFSPPGNNKSTARPEHDLQVIKPTFELVDCDRPQIAWLGHASVYVLLPGDPHPIGILFDPIFSKRYAVAVYLCLKEL